MTIHDKDAALSALRQLAGRHNTTSADDVALQGFLDWLARAGRTGWRELDDQRAAFAAESAPLISACARLLADYVTHTERIFQQTWYGHEWITACERRSRIQFLYDLYGDTPAAQTLATWVDSYEVDDRLRQKGELEGGLENHEIPPGTPKSHWWWWYPGAPGAAK